MIIYQVLPRLYGNRNTNRIPNASLSENGSGKMNDFTDRELKRIQQFGFTHIWYTGIIRHATLTDYTAHGIPANHPAIVKGKAGSPYAITDYYDIDPDIAVDVDHRMSEFEMLVKRTHQAKLKMIIDFVPNHVARQYHSITCPGGKHDLGQDDDTSMAFSPKNNFYYTPGHPFAPFFDLCNGADKPYEEIPAKATGNDHFDPMPGRNDWYETVKLNFGVDYAGGRVNHFEPIPDTWLKMTEILLFWASKGIDGFRCDMAEMVPSEFWAYATAKVKQRYPEILFIGEVYNPSEYRLYITSGFDYLYDKVGMYDTMRQVICGNSPTSAITQTWQSVDDIHSHMLYFLENHDEQRIASDFFAGNGTKAIPAMIASALMQGNPFMLYAGEEYGEKGMDEEGFSGRDGRTTIFDYWNIDTLCRAAWHNLSDEEERLADIHRRVFAIANQEKAIKDGLFFDLMYVNSHLQRQYIFLRKAENELILTAVNFEDREVSIGVNLPSHAFEFMKIPEKTITAQDLLTGHTQDLILQKESCIALKIGARGGIVLKIRL